MRVYISPSSQTNNKYAYGSYTEAQVCRKIGEYMYNRIQERYKDRITCKLASASLDVSGRIKDSNNFGADLHYCIHTNAGGGDGTLVMCYPGYEKNEYVTRAYNAISRLSPGKDDGIKTRTDLAEITDTTAVCVYVEVEFHDIPSLAKWIVGNMQKIGYALADSILGEFEENVSRETLYKVQIGAFKNRENAEKLKSELKSKGYDTFIKIE